MNPKRKVNFSRPDQSLHQSSCQRRRLSVQTQCQASIKVLRNPNATNVTLSSISSGSLPPQHPGIRPVTFHKGGVRSQRTRKGATFKNCPFNISFLVPQLLPRKREVGRKQHAPLTISNPSLAHNGTPFLLFRAHSFYPPFSKQPPPHT